MFVILFLTPLYMPEIFHSFQKGNWRCRQYLGKERGNKKEIKGVGDETKRRNQQGKRKRDKGMVLNPGVIL